MAERVISLVHAFTTAHTTHEVVEIATMLRIPVAPIGNGENIPTMDHFVERGVFTKNPGRGFLQPRVPYRITGHSTATVHRGAVARAARPRDPATNWHAAGRRTSGRRQTTPARMPR
jgi:crotonobetainyl-CoA:carnitine CoA-transferase CaiB-like acyl-CoA transferase